MGIIQDVYNRLSGKRKRINLSSDCCNLDCNCEYVKFVIECCINLIARTFASVHFRQYVDNSETDNMTSYILNVKPNKNDNAADFWREIIRRMLWDGEVIAQYSTPNNKPAELYIPESWSLKDDRTFKNSTYTANYTGLNKTFILSSDEVFHFRYDEHYRVAKFAAVLFCDLDKAYAQSLRSYTKDRARKGILNINAYWSQRDDIDDVIKQILNDSFKPFYEADGDAVLPLQDGFKYQELTGQREATAEGRNLFRDIVNAVSMIFGIPANLLIGENVDSETNVTTLISTGLNPIARIIETELNAKLYEPDEYLSGSRIDADLLNVKVSSITDQAKNMDVLFRMGYSVDDILKAMGKPTINQDWAQQHYVTKNYQNIKNMEGGIA